MARAREYANTVELPEFDEKAAYDHDRPISGLIRTQLLHLHVAENYMLPESERSDVNINELHTERQASEYIAEVTAKLHRRAEKKKQTKRASKSVAAKRKRSAPKKSSGKKTAAKKTAKKAAKAVRKNTAKTKSSAKTTKRS